MEDLGAERLIYGNIRERAHTGHVVSRLPGNVEASVEAGRTYPFAALRRDLRFFDIKTGLSTEGSLP
jgi:multiple sugar transport system ATP-binding protein